MQKNIQDLGAFLVNLLPPKLPQVYDIDPLFNDIADEVDIRNGIQAFWEFLHNLYGRLISEGEIFHKPKKEAHAFTDNTSLAASFPFLNNLLVVMTNMGLKSILCQERDMLLLDSIDSLTSGNKIAKAKISHSELKKCLSFLSNCGIVVNDSEITAPESPSLLIGLKAMVLAQEKLQTTATEYTLLRCDYRVLANKQPDIFGVLCDITNPLSSKVQESVRNLHLDYMKHGYKCTFATTNFYIRFTYYCRSKELWRFNYSLNNGYNLGIKANNTDKYPDILTSFPDVLQEKIQKGYGCGKKRGTTDSCDGGCRGIRIPLDDSFMGNAEFVKMWIDKEVSYAQSKK